MILWMDGLEWDLYHMQKNSCALGQAEYKRRIWGKVADKEGKSHKESFLHSPTSLPFVSLKSGEEKQRLWKMTPNKPTSWEPAGAAPFQGSPRGAI